MVDIERTIQKTCEHFQVPVRRLKNSNCHKPSVVEARRQVAQILYYGTDLPVRRIGELLGQKTDSARLGRGAFKFDEEGEAQFSLPPIV
jgi:chromosomal replication initiation ATPase DnaA